MMAPAAVGCKPGQPQQNGDHERMHRTLKARATKPPAANAQELLRNALALSPEERASVAAELLASLDEPVPDDAAAMQAAWAREIETRARRVLSGDSVGQPWPEVRARIADRLARP